MRAVAVLAVLAFHAFPGALPGGFVGVDIFFVISGFLITGIILNDLRNQTFTFERFYQRRVRRIFPALGLILGGSLLFGWWMLLPADYRDLGANVSAGAGFVSNLRLWSESGYFDTAATSKPLLHLWSLGVEEQYYLIWPLFLLLMYRHQRHIVWMIVLVAVVSFGLNIFLVQHHTSAAFYFPVTRFWELMLGSLLACWNAACPQAPEQVAEPALVRRLGPNTLATTGAALLVVALALNYDDHTFPGWWALLPAIGTTLLVAAGRTAWINRKVLAHPGVVFVGLISYPLYLWHWPLLTYARIMLGGNPPAVVRAILLVTSGVLAWLTYELIEKKVRGSMPTSRARRTAAMLAAAMAALGTFGWLVLEARIPARSASIPEVASISAAFDDWSYRGDRVIRGDTPRAVLFFGDSHMQQFLPRIEEVMRDRRAPLHTVVFQTHAGCAPIPGIERTGFQCEQFVTNGLARAHQPDVETVVIGASWVGLTDRDDYYRTDGRGSRVGQPLDLHKADLPWVLARFEAAVQDLVRDGKHVVIILSSPRGDAFNPRYMVTREGSQFRVNIRPAVPRSEVLAALGGIDARLAGIARRVGADIVDPMDAMCHAGMCPTIDSQGNPYFMDETHLRSSVVRAHFDELDKYVYLSAGRAQPGSQRWPNAVTHRATPGMSSWFPEPSSAGH